MAIEDLLADLHAGQIKREVLVTRAEAIRVTSKPAQALVATRETPVTRQKTKEKVKHNKLVFLPVTLDYFRAKGVGLMQEDLALLRWYLPRDVGQHNAWIKHYMAIWKEAMEKEPIEHCKQDSGRKAANTWLRKEKP